MWDWIAQHLVHLGVFALIELLIIVTFVPWALAIKRDTAPALAWTLFIVFVPILGAVLFVLFGYQSVHRPLLRKRTQRKKYKALAAELASREMGGSAGRWTWLTELGERLDAFPVAPGNAVEIYREGNEAFDAMRQAIDEARHHVHLEFFIIHADGLGQEIIKQLANKARSGVEVRLLYDAIGSYGFHPRHYEELTEAGGRVAAFLPVSLWRRRIQVNLRNHRKILVADGQVGFTGGLNIGDEYLGKSSEFGPWRDTHIRVEGPAALALQRVFAEDWDFAADELLKGERYFPEPKFAGDVPIQVVASGPDQEFHSIRELYFAALLRARKRVWITTPYYVPDNGLRDALCTLAMTGVDVRIIIPQNPDKWLPYFAAHYYMPDLLTAGVKVYWYQEGFMHAKGLIVDDDFASVGSVNFDNRSLLLNFEATCFIFDAATVARLMADFETDMHLSIRIESKSFAKRPWASRMIENVSRLFSPVL